MREKQTIVLAKVEMTGLEPTGAMERFDGVNYRPQMRVAPRAAALVWLNEGTDADLAKAKAYATTEGYEVLTFPTTEEDPLGLARAAVLKAHALR